MLHFKIEADVVSATKV